MLFFKEKQVSGDGLLAARPLDMPDAREPGRATRPHVVGKLDANGQWCVLMLVPVPGRVAGEVTLDPDEAELLARQLREYAALVRDKLGLPAGAAYP